MDICTKCGKEGYLFQEKIRKRGKNRRKAYENKRHKLYESAKRIRHHYWSFIHNIKVNGKWTIRKCYLGIRKESESHCNCSYCKQF